MKNYNSIKTLVAMGLLTLGSGSMVSHAQQAEDVRSMTEFISPCEEIDAIRDPFSVHIERNPVEKADKDSKKSVNKQTAEALDAQARILYARGDRDMAIAMQKLAVEKAKYKVEEFSKTLAKYTEDVNRLLIEKKLREIIIPEVRFVDESLEGVVASLRVMSFELDTTVEKDAEKGVNFVILAERTYTTVDTGHLDPFSAVDASSKTRTKVDVNVPELALKNVPLGEVVKYVCELTGMKMEVDSHAVVIRSAE